MAPARAAPCDSSARRSRRPLPATRSMEFTPLRCLDVVMFRSPRRHSYRVPTGPDHDVGNAAPLWLRCLERRPRITMREPVGAGVAKFSSTANFIPEPGSFRLALYAEVGRVR